MFRREVTGIFLAIAASILVLFSSKEVFLSVMILAFLFLLYELIKVTKKFNVKELVLLESKIYKSNSEEEELKVLMANKKMEEIVAYCISKIIK